MSPGDPPPRLFLFFLNYLLLGKGKTRHSSDSERNHHCHKNSSSRNALGSYNAYFYFVEGGNVEGEQKEKWNKALLPVTPHTLERRYAQGDERRSWIG